MAEEECNIDDILCQLRVLDHLRGIRAAIGDIKFPEIFPEFKGLDDTLTEKMIMQDKSLREMLQKCGLPSPEKLEVEFEDMEFEE